MTYQDEKEQSLTALLRRPVFPHERSQWLAEIEHHARMAGVTVTIHDVNLNKGSHRAETIATRALNTAIKTL